MMTDFLNIVNLNGSDNRHDCLMDFPFSPKYEFVGEYDDSPSFTACQLLSENSRSVEMNFDLTNASCCTDMADIVVVNSVN